MKLKITLIANNPLNISEEDLIRDIEKKDFSGVEILVIRVEEVE